MNFNVKLSESVVVIFMLARNENRAKLEEHADSLGSGPFVSPVGRFCGSFQAQSFENLRGNFLAFDKERNLEKLTQLFHGPGDGGMNEGRLR